MDTPLCTAGNLPPICKKRGAGARQGLDRKSTRLNSSHQIKSYAVFCLKKKKSRLRPGSSGRKSPFRISSVSEPFKSDYLNKRALPCQPRRFFFFNDTATTEIYTLSLHDALPI